MSPAMQHERKCFGDICQGETELGRSRVLYIVDVKWERQTFKPGLHHPRILNVISVVLTRKAALELAQRQQEENLNVSLQK